MTRFQLSCSSCSTDKLLRYARTILSAHIPGVGVTVECPCGSDDPLRLVWLEIATPDVLPAIRQTLDMELILTEGPSGNWPCIEVYDDWRE